MTAIFSLASCNLDTKNENADLYEDWFNRNQQWLAEQAELKDANGKPVYTVVKPKWNSNAYVLMRWFNDTTLNADNLRPLYTSTVDCKYYGRLYNDVPFDSSYANLTPADSIYRTRLTDVIPGWTIAFERMRVGDTVEVIVPFSQGYGAQESGSIPAYSNLKFNIKLVDVYKQYLKQ